MTQIRLVQVPKIEHDLVRVGISVTQRIESLNIKGQVATEETVGALKKLRAELNAEFKEFEEQRKAIKDAVMNPYNELDEIYKLEVSEKYKSATDMLKDKIAEVEDKIKSDRMEEVKLFFVELCLDRDIDFLSWPQLGIDIKLSDSMKSYKDRVTLFVDKVVDELQLIDTQAYKAEIMVEYKKTLNAAKAIKEVQDRKDAEQRERERDKLTETQRRQTELRKLSMVYKDLTKSFNWVNDDNVYITNHDVENLSKEEFNKRYVELEQAIKSLTPDTKTPEVIQPLKAPVVEQPKQQEKTLTATFSATGTMAQLTALAEYMKQNNITYKNI